MTAFYEPALVLGDHGADLYIRFTPGYNDECDRPSILVETRHGACRTADLRLPVSEVPLFAKRLIELAMGQPIHLTIRKAEIRPLKAGRRKKGDG